MNETILIAKKRDGSDVLVCGRNVPWGQQLAKYRELSGNATNDELSRAEIVYLQPAKKPLKFITKAEFEARSKPALAPKVAPSVSLDEAKKQLEAAQTKEAEAAKVLITAESNLKAAKDALATATAKKSPEKALKDLNEKVLSAKKAAREASQSQANAADAVKAANQLVAQLTPKPEK